MNLLNKEVLMTAVESAGAKNIIIGTTAAVALVGISVYGIIRNKKNKAKIAAAHDKYEREIAKHATAEKLRVISNVANTRGITLTNDDSSVKVKISPTDPKITDSGNLFVEPADSPGFYINTENVEETEKLLAERGLTVSKIYEAVIKD